MSEATDGSQSSEEDDQITENMKKLVDPEQNDEKQSSENNGSSTTVGSSSTPTMDPANLHYEGSTCIYTDPSTKYQFQWNDKEQQWIPIAGTPSVAEPSQDAPNSSNGKNYVFDGESYTYKDDQSGVVYKWDNAKSQWRIKGQGSKIKEVPKGKQKLDDDVEENDTDEEEEKVEVRQDMNSGRYDFDGENHTYTDPKDGTIYFWDKEKNAWFPKVDDDFMAQYQMSYGFVDKKSEDTSGKEDDSSKPLPNAADLKRKASQEPQWFELDERHNTKMYVSNLPLDITEQEFVDFMQKCGLIMKDVDTNRMKIKLYHEPGNPKELKGDALCTYIKRESVDLALKILDGADLRGYKVNVEQAKFQMKGEYDPTRKPKKKRRKDKEKIKKAQEKLFDWRPDKLRGERSKHERTVIIKNLFDPKIFDTDVGLILEFQQDLREEASKCGNVRKVIVYDRHPDGVAQINFKEAEEADECVQLFNNRWFNKRQISAETWDGKTKYRIAESAEETEARLAKWTKYLESEEGKKSALAQNYKAEDEGQNSDDDEGNEANPQKTESNDESEKSVNVTLTAEEKSSGKLTDSSVQDKDSKKSTSGCDNTEGKQIHEGSKDES